MLKIPAKLHIDPEVKHDFRNISAYRTQTHSVALCRNLVHQFTPRSVTNMDSMGFMPLNEAKHSCNCRIFMKNSKLHSLCYSYKVFFVTAPARALFGWICLG